MNFSDKDGRGSPVDIVIREIESHERKFGLLSVTSINQTLANARDLPRAKNLYKNLIWQGENHFLFGETGSGKSAFIVQTGENIAMDGHNVLYVDCELSEIMFSERYTDEKGTTHSFPENFYRARIDTTNYIEAHFEEEILKNIIQAAECIKAEVVIIDNLTYLCNGGERGDIASYFMKNLKAVQLAKHWTLIVVAHTTKRDLSCPMSINDMAGSKRFVNFIDNVFCINQSYKEKDLRYVKQLKVRNHNLIYNENSVLMMRLEKDGDYLKLESIGYDKERKHLMVRNANTVAQMKEDAKNKAKEYAALGYSLRQIAEELGTSKSSAFRMIKESNAEENNNNIPPENPLFHEE